MHGGQETLDIVVRSEEEGVALVLTASVLEQSQLVLVGALTDRELGSPIATTISVDLAEELIGDVHVPRETSFNLALNERDVLFEWQVKTRDLDNEYRLQDAHIRSDLGNLRAFAIEDLATAVGIGLGVGAAAALAWLNDRRDKGLKVDADRKWADCLERGGSPSWVGDGKAKASLAPNGIDLELGTRYEVKCDMSNAAQ